MVSIIRQRERQRNRLLKILLNAWVIRRQVPRFPGRLQRLFVLPCVKVPQAGQVPGMLSPGGRLTDVGSGPLGDGQGPACGPKHTVPVLLVVGQVRQVQPGLPEMGCLANRPENPPFRLSRHLQGKIILRQQAHGGTPFIRPSGCRQGQMPLEHGNALLPPPVEKCTLRSLLGSSSTASSSRGRYCPRLLLRSAWCSRQTPSTYRAWGAPPSNWSTSWTGFTQRQPFLRWILSYQNTIPSRPSGRKFQT